MLMEVAGRKQVQGAVKAPEMLSTQGKRRSQGLLLTSSSPSTRLGSKNTFRLLSWSLPKREGHGELEVLGDLHFPGGSPNQ